MAGYDGYSMSNNARESYRNGMLPLSKWTKSKIVSSVESFISECESYSEISNDLPAIKDTLNKIIKFPVNLLKENMLVTYESHHTSKFYNMTEFYDFKYKDYDIDKYLLQNLQDDLSAIQQSYLDIKNSNSEDKEKKIDKIEPLYECEYLIWSGSRNHPKAYKYTETGTIKGQTFTSVSGVKKRVNSNGFQILRTIYQPKNYNQLKSLCDDLTVRLGDIDTSQITDMSYLFKDSQRTNIQFTGIEKWDVSKVENMNGMFNAASNFNRDISNWDVSNVTDMTAMFENAEKFNQSLDAWTINDECFLSSFADKCPIENDLTKLPKAVVEDLIKENDETYTQEQLDAVAEKFSLDISYIKPKPQIEDLIEENSISR